MFDLGARQPVGGEGDGGPVSVVPPGPKLALNGPDNNILNAPQLELHVVCFTTIRPIRYVPTARDRPSTPFNRNYRTCRHFWRYVNDGDMMNIRLE